ncbi:MAG TPA: hypothetical protein VN493_28710 [Thermoanaerobaculia bacterium]|nr:hypothetical protein [Thermoanaerobaculia bacterium]
MAGRTLCRTVLCILVVALLLPLAGASAAQPREAAAGIQIPEWSRALLQSADGLLGRFVSMFERDASPPPSGGRPTDPSGQEGNGFDPHGGKKP